MTGIVQFPNADDKYRKQCREAAKANKIMLEEYLEAGFTEDQALRIICSLPDIAVIE